MYATILRFFSTTILSLFKGYWKYVVMILIAAAMAIGGGMYVDNKLKDAYKSGYEQAVSESNENTLRTSLSFANEKIAKLEALAKERQEIIDKKIVETEERIVFRDRVVKEIEEVTVEGSCEEALPESSKKFLDLIQERQNEDL